MSMMACRVWNQAHMLTGGRQGRTSAGFRCSSRPLPQTSGMTWTCLGWSRARPGRTGSSGMTRTSLGRAWPGRVGSGSTRTRWACGSGRVARCGLLTCFSSYHTNSSSASYDRPPPPPSLSLYPSLSHARTQVHTHNLQSIAPNSPSPPTPLPRPPRFSPTPSPSPSPLALPPSLPPPATAIAGE